MLQRRVILEADAPIRKPHTTFVFEFAIWPSALPFGKIIAQKMLLLTLLVEGGNLEAIDLHAGTLGTLAPFGPLSFPLSKAL